MIHEKELMLADLSLQGNYFTLIKEGELSPKEFDGAAPFVFSSTHTQGNPTANDDGWTIAIWWSANDGRPTTRISRWFPTEPGKRWISRRQQHVQTEELASTAEHAFQYATIRRNETRRTTTCKEGLQPIL